MRQVTIFGISEIHKRKQMWYFFTFLALFYSALAHLRPPCYHKPLALDINCKCPALITLNQTDFFTGFLSFHFSSKLSSASTGHGPRHPDCFNKWQTGTILLFYSDSTQMVHRPWPWLWHPRCFNKLELFYYFTRMALSATPWPPSDPHNVYCRHPTKCQTESLVELSRLSCFLLPWTIHVKWIALVVCKPRVSFENKWKWKRLKLFSEYFFNLWWY